MIVFRGLHTYKWVGMDDNAQGNPLKKCHDNFSHDIEFLETATEVSDVHLHFSVHVLIRSTTTTSIRK